MKTNEQLMKACQIGCNNLNDANNLLAECYGRIGKLITEHAWAIGEAKRLTEENERLRKDAEKLAAMPVRYVSLQHIKTKVTDANPNPVRVNVISERNSAWLDMPREKIDIMRTEMQAAIDAARGAK